MMIINTKIVENANLSVEDFGWYLSQQGWQELPGQNKHLRVLQGINDDLGNPLLLVLPRQNDAVDAIRYMAQALETIASIENKSLEEALAKIQSSKQNSYQLSRYDEAIESYDRAVAIKPDTHEAWYNRGVSLSNLGRYEESNSS